MHTAQNAPRAEQHYRADIDGLRAVAILGVVAYHVGVPGITGGYVGVDIFFVLSGYLITQLLSRELDQTGTLSIANFYARRLRRLLPALGLVIVATLLLSSFLLPPAGPREELAESALTSLLFVANHFFLAQSGGYFAGAAELKPLLHLWSLSVEEQFYVVWPFVLIAIALLTRARTRLAWMRAAIAVIIVTSFVLSTWLVRHYLAAAFYTAPSRAWELGIGALLALTADSRFVQRPFVASATANVGALLIGASFLLLQWSTRFPGPAALPAVLGTALVIWGNAQSPRTILYRLLSSKPMVAIGLTSYGWYLWHWPILAYLRALSLMRLGIGTAAAGALLAYALAALSLKYVETPIRRGTLLRRASTTRVLQLGMASLAAMALMAGGSWAWAKYGPRSEREQLYARVDADTPDDANFRCMIQRDKWTGTLHPDTCRFGSPGKNIDIVIWGDSHAMALTPILRALQQDGAPAFRQLTMAACPPFVGMPGNAAEINADCPEFNSQALGQILQLRSAGLKGVILAGRWVSLMGDLTSRSTGTLHPVGVRNLWKHLQPPSVQSSVELFSVKLRATLETLETLGLRVLIFQDIPNYLQSVPNCAYYEFPDLMKCGISRADYDDQLAAISTTIRTVAGDFKAVRVFDPIPQVCDTSHCPAFVGDRPIVWDKDHIAASTARTLAPLAAPDIDWLQQADSPPVTVANAGKPGTTP